MNTKLISRVLIGVVLYTTLMMLISPLELMGLYLLVIGAYYALFWFVLRCGLVLKEQAEILLADPELCEVVTQRRIFGLDITFTSDTID